MAPGKRKIDGIGGSARPEKQQKRSSTSKISVLKEEEPFPRGGASILTPLEQKQIQIQAKQDVLFEQSTGKKAVSNDLEDEENQEMQALESGPAITKSKSKSRAKSKKGAKQGLVEEATIRIEGLSYKRLVPGSIVLGQISHITHYDIALSLPNNLTGYVPLTSISDIFTKKMEAFMNVNEADEDEEDDTDIDLNKHFSIGQYLRAYVTSTQEETSTGAQGKRHIKLSINPREANSSLKKTDYVANSVVQAAVLSVEDHGLIMDVGLNEIGIRGFMSSKELGKNVDSSKVEEGSIFLCLVIGKGSNGNIIKLSADPQKIGNVKNGSFLSDAPTVDGFLPGTAVDVLISEVTTSGIAGKVMGLLNVTADLIHSGAAASGKDLEKKYPVGSKVKGRIICTFPTSEEKKLGISLQDHVLYWRSKTITSTTPSEGALPTEMMSISAIVNEARVVRVEQGFGLLVDVGVKGVRGFVHISRISDGKIETLSESTGAYKIGSVHKARIIGYNSMDGLFLVSMESKIISQPFLRIEDVKVGQVVKGTIEKIMVNAEGVSGVLVSIAEGITGLVPEMHLADIHLQHPEKKFKEGHAVTARVLSTNPEKRQMRLTLKKTLVNSDSGAWSNYNDLKPGMQSPGTLVNILPSGAVVQFYGSIRGFLPISEMSESYIQDPKQLFRKGQVVSVHVVSVDPTGQRMIVSCKDPCVFGSAQQEALKSLIPGAIVDGNVTEKTNEEIIVDLNPAGLKAMLPIEHLGDGSSQKIASAAKRIRVGQVLQDLVVLAKQDTKGVIRLTGKPSLVRAAKDGHLLKAFDDVVDGAEVQGYVQNITPTGVFVQFAANLTSLLLKQHLKDEIQLLPNFGMRRHQSISAQVLSVDDSQERFLLTMKPLAEVNSTLNARDEEAADFHDTGLTNPVDGVSTSLNDFTLGKLTKARIISIKETQMNVQLAEGVQGRVDVSETFDTWEEVTDRKHPLKRFHTKQVLPVRIMGMHDSRNHRFLPITHRGKAPVFELTAKPSNQNSADLNVLTLDKVETGSSWLVFVNNVADDCVWVNLSPNVRGRIRAMDVSDDVSQLADLSNNFPVGSVLRAKAVKVDVENNRLDLSARSGNSSLTTLNDLSEGMIIPGRVTKVTDRMVMVQLSDSISGPIHLVDMADDYSKADPLAYTKNQTIRLCIRDIDVPNKRVILSTRPSKVFSSSLPVLDKDVSSISQLKVNDVMRGFVKNVADSGVFVSLASNVTAFVRVSDLSDLYIKDWKANFQVDQLVKGKVLAVDPSLHHVQMSLKRSHIDSDYKAPFLFTDMEVGQIVAGRVRRVADFGVFVIVDNSANVSGLCHRTQLSDRKNADPKKLYEEGDAVQAKVLNINKQKRQMSFGLKASYFNLQAEKKEEGQVLIDASDDGENEATDDTDEDMESTNDIEVRELSDARDRKDLDQDATVFGLAPDEDSASDFEMDDGAGGVVVPRSKDNNSSITNENSGLSTGGFDWTDGVSTLQFREPQSETDSETTRPKKKKRRKAEIKVDRTGDLDANGPQSTSDFERLLLGQPNSSVLWLSYMAFQLQVSEVGKAREIGERALKTINIREDTEKLNVWIALLNLENTYGNDESLEELFKRACEYNDSQDIHERLISIYIQSGKHSKADELFQAALKKQHTKHHSQDPAIYLNYATYLMNTYSSPDRARALLPRAMQALPSYTHLSLTRQFAQLEFKHGDPERGRTMFETLLSQWPKRLDIWNVLLDLEINQKDEGKKERVRRLFERITRGGGGLKPRKAKFFFKRWLEFEGREGDGKGVERVKALAEEYVWAQGRREDAD